MIANDDWEIATFGCLHLQHSQRQMSFECSNVVVIAQSKRYGIRISGISEGFT